MHSLAARCCSQRPACVTSQLSSSRRVTPCSWRVCNGRDPSYAADQGPDMVSSMLNSCIAGTARLADTAVSRLADMLQSVAPPAAPRHKIEVSVKGALVLLLLGLLKGVISVVLLVGCIALAVYTATQVFGWSGVLLSQQGASGYGVWAGGSYRQQQQQYPFDPPPPGQGYQQGPAGRRPYHQQQQQYDGGRQQQQRRQRQQQQQQGNWPPGDQGDLVDVFHYGKSAEQ